MSAATVASEITTGDNIETGLISGRSAAAVGPAAPVVADGTPAPDRGAGGGDTRGRPRAASRRAAGRLGHRASAAWER